MTIFSISPTCLVFSQSLPVFVVVVCCKCYFLVVVRGGANCFLFFLFPYLFSLDFVTPGFCRDKGVLSDFPTSIGAGRIRASPVQPVLHFVLLISLLIIVLCSILFYKYLRKNRCTTLTTTSTLANSSRSATGTGARLSGRRNCEATRTNRRMCR